VGDAHRVGSGNSAAHTARTSGPAQPVDRPISPLFEIRCLVPVRFVRPMLAASAGQLPVGDSWTYEVKWDGYRTLALKSGSRVQLMSRNLNDATARYPSIAKAVADLGGDVALLDGEAVALDERGHPSFQALHLGAATTLVFYAFDLLHLNGRDLARMPLEERRARLAVVTRGTQVRQSDPLPGTAQQIEAAVRALRLEGVVAKRRDSPYEAGKRSNAWVKVKFNKRQEFVVGGLKPSGASFESLLVGYYEGTQLCFAGKVRAGLTAHIRAAILQRLVNDHSATCPFADLPTPRTGHWGEGVTAEEMKALVWVRPKLVVEVSFVEWPIDGLLRHSEFVSMRDDKVASKVGRDLESG
jgi:bifunctional non-homologous end joining protein LigD